ncbi:hypothetical protein Tco_0725955 [Tanacetum coccineum]|uniref:Reverse transcriptase domain-containing protein n=1 Tax=Tanacetum coccineum TaxID=301880 RepID=A0ABQ4YE68_9ASTR
MVAIFHNMIEKTMEVFMDDFSVFDDSFSSCLSHLDKMLQRCEDTNLVLNWEKCHFMVKEGIVLGHKISKTGIEVDKEKVDVIAKLPHPTTVKDVNDFTYAELPMLCNLHKVKELNDLKAQMQDKNIAISELKKLLRKLQRKAVETQLLSGNLLVFVRELSGKHLQLVIVGSDLYTISLQETTSSLQSVSWLKLHQPPKLGLVPQRKKASDYDNSDPVPPRQHVVPTAEKTDSLVAPANRLKIGKSNFQLSSDLKSKEATLQVVYDVLKLTPFYKAF